MRESIAIVYKNLVDIGGAERLVIEEFLYFYQRGYNVFLFVNHISDSAVFEKKLPDDRVVSLKVSKIYFPLRLAYELKKKQIEKVICSSGHLDVYIAGLFCSIPYWLHIHHPNFMSFNDYDKYAVFMRHKFKEYCVSNFGATRFIKIQKQLSLWQKITLNLRALISLKSHRKAKSVFVLSEYARQEKSDLYGIETEVLQGALSAKEIHERSKFRVKRDFEKNRYLSVARLDKNKRLDLVIESLGYYAEFNDKKVTLDLVGTGPERENLIELARTHSRWIDVQFHGYVSDEELVEIYAKTSIFVSVDWADYKITMFESLSYGVPVLISNETELSKNLKLSGFVHTCQPERKSIIDALQSSQQAVYSCNDYSYLEKALEAVSWESYFKAIENLVLER